MNNTTAIEEDLGIQHSLEVTAYLLTLILGTGGNILVLIVIIGRRRRRSVNDLFIANLAISDLAYLLFFLPFQTHAKLFGNLSMSVAYCKFVYPMMTAIFSVAIFTLMSMALCRCYFVVHPFKARLRHRTVLLWVVLIWLFSIALTLPIMIVTQVEYEYNSCYEKWSERSGKIYTVVLLIIQCVLPLVIISAAYTRIAIDLLSSKTARASINRRGQVTTDKGSQENRQVIRSLIVIVVLFVICMFPLQITWMIFQFGSEHIDDNTLNILFIVSDILSVIHACMNPVVYGTLTRQFRRGYIKYLSYCLCCYRELLRNHYSLTTRLQSRNTGRSGGETENPGDKINYVWMESSYTSSSTI